MTGKPVHSRFSRTQGNPDFTAFSPAEHGPSLGKRNTEGQGGPPTLIHGLWHYQLRCSGDGGDGITKVVDQWRRRTSKRLTTEVKTATSLEKLHHHQRNTEVSDGGTRVVKTQCRAWIMRANAVLCCVNLGMGGVWRWHNVMSGVRLKLVGKRAHRVLGLWGCLLLTPGLYHLYFFHFKPYCTGLEWLGKKKINQTIILSNN